MSLSAMAHLQLNRLVHLSLVRAPAVVSAVKLRSFNTGFRSTGVGSSRGLVCFCCFHSVLDEAQALCSVSKIITWEKHSQFRCNVANTFYMHSGLLQSFSE